MFNLLRALAILFMRGRDPPFCRGATSEEVQREKEREEERVVGGPQAVLLNFSTELHRGNIALHAAAIVVGHSLKYKFPIIILCQEQLALRVAQSAFPLPFRSTGHTVFPYSFQ